MANVKLLKISADGIPLEHTASADDITFLSFTVNGGGPVMSGSGIDMNSQDLTDVNLVTFTDPSTGTINQTAGNLIIDNIMAKDRENLMTTSGSVSFPLISDVAGQVDSFRLPEMTTTPTATPTTGGAGHMVYDSTSSKPYIWTGSSWDDLSTVSSAENIDDSYLAEVAIAARDVVYISSADNVSPAVASAGTSSQVVGLATAAQPTPASAVTIRKTGRLAGFTGLTAGARYYLDGSTAGAITATAPSASGHTIVQIGYAKNTTTLDIQVQSLGRRS